MSDISEVLVRLREYLRDGDSYSAFDDSDLRALLDEERLLRGLLKDASDRLDYWFRRISRRRALAKARREQVHELSREVVRAQARTVAQFRKTLDQKRLADSLQAELAAEKAAHAETRRKL